VIAQGPESISKVVALVRLYEKKYTNISPSYIPTNRFHSNISEYQNKNNNLPPLLPTPNTKPLSHMVNIGSVKRMTPTELQIRREKSLCYTCDAKFTLNHRYPNKHMFLLQVEESDKQTIEPDPPPDIKQLLEIEHHLSYNTLKGANGLGTLKFQGQL